MITATAARAAIVLAMVATSAYAAPRELLDAIRHVETGGERNGGRDAIGDNGRSIGPYQIGRAYWLDSRVPGSWDDCRDTAYAERVMAAYWARYCPAALSANDMETLARVHNGGPSGHRKQATTGYWRKVKAAMDK